MKVYLEPVGCRLNEAENRSWSKGFQAAGHTVLSTPHDADLMVFNSCAVTSDAVKRSRQRTRKLHRVNPTAKLVMTGCYASLQPQEAASLAGVDLVINNSEKDDLVDIIAREFDLAAMPQLATEPGSSHVFAKRRTRAFLKVQDGCRNRCTFCIVTIARGEERSRSIDAIVTEIQRLEDEGYQEVVLTGVHLGGYGSDHGTSLTKLVQAVLERTRIPRIRLGSLEPWDLPDTFFSLWENARLCPHLHLPLQSGSDAMLKKMARRCSVEHYEHLASLARTVQPSMNLTTDLIVGFPTETDQHFAESLQAIQRIGFGHIHIFSYSPRMGTAAATMAGQLPRAVKRERSRIVHDVAATMKQQTLQQAVGQTRSVLWEHRTQTEDGLKHWQGYTDNFLRVHTATQAPHDLHNHITDTPLSHLTGENTLLGAIAQH